VVAGGGTGCLLDHESGERLVCSMLQRRRGRMTDDRSYDGSSNLRSYSNDETPLLSTRNTVEVTTGIGSHSNTSRFTVPTIPQSDMFNAIMVMMDRQAENDRERREEEAEQRRLDREAMLQQFKMQIRKTETEPLQNRLKSELVYRMASISCGGNNRHLGIGRTN